MAEETPTSKLLWREVAAEYLHAVANLPDLCFRLAFKRRDLEDALVEASLRGVLRRAFGFWELLLLGCGMVVGTGIYSTTGRAAWLAAGPAVVISYALGGLASLLAALVLGEFAVEYPVSGGGFTYTMLTFGELPAFLTLSNLVLSYAVGMAAVAGQISFNLGALTNYNVDFIVGDSSITWNLDFFAFGAVLAATVVLSLGPQEYAYIVSGATVLKLAALLTIIIAAFTRADPTHVQGWVPGGVAAVFTGLQISFYSYVGFDALTNTVEEAQDPDDVPKAMCGTVVIAVLLYVPLALSFVMLMPYNCVTQLLDPSYLLSRVFTIQGTEGADCSHCMGLQWLQYFISATALVSVVTSLFVGLYSLTRLVMVAARDWLLPPYLAAIYPRTQTPLAAQLTVGVVVAIIALVVPVERLGVLVSWGSLFAMWMICNAHLFRRYWPDIKLRYTKYGQVEAVRAKRSWQSNLAPHVQKGLVSTHMLLVSAVTTGLAIYWRTSPDRTAAFAFVGAWALVTLSFQLLCPLEYQPAAKWAVPWWAMPWLPSLAIALIIFSLGSLTGSEYWHVAVYFAGALTFYLLFSLPLSYIKRRRLDYVNTEQMNVVELAFRNGQWVILGTAPSALSGLGPRPASPQSGGHSLGPTGSAYSAEVQSNGTIGSGLVAGTRGSAAIARGSGAGIGFRVASYAHGGAGVSLGGPAKQVTAGGQRRPSKASAAAGDAAARLQHHQRLHMQPYPAVPVAAGQQVELQQERRAPAWPSGHGTLPAGTAGSTAVAAGQQQGRAAPPGQSRAGQPPSPRSQETPSPWSQETQQGPAAAAAEALAAAFRSQASQPSWRSSAVTTFQSIPEGEAPASPAAEGGGFP